MVMKMTNTYPYKIAALYRFVALSDIPALKDRVAAECTRLNICGTLLIAPEGINGTIAGAPDDLDTIVDFLDGLFAVRQGELKYSHASDKPFKRMKVRPKKEIITMKQPDADPTKLVGTYVAPKDWNAIISDPDVVVLDTRNQYETAVGTFRGAIDPKTEFFTEFPDFVKQHLDPAKHKKVAMYCTGGIRCEKASSYMLSQGFEEVYHLKGGILQYLEDIPAEESLWDGGCFVFDQRVAVTHGLKEGTWDICLGCGHPLTPEEHDHDAYEAGVSCSHCHAGLSDERRTMLRQRHNFLIRERGEGTRA